MVLLVHNNHTVVEVIDLENNQVISVAEKMPLKVLFHLAKNRPNCILVWCDTLLKPYLNVAYIKSAFYLKNMMVSYASNHYFSNRIGYIEDSPFLNVNKKLKYPTWLMSSNVGAIFSTNLLKFESEIDLNRSFDYALNAIAKLGMPNGLLCYSAPDLLTKPINLKTPKQVSTLELFKFVKSHYKRVWHALLLINIIIYERKFPFLAFLQTLFYKHQTLELKSTFDLELIQHINVDENVTIDVIIPTMGRKLYLYDVLEDLSHQTKRPENVIIVEQNEDVNSNSELDYIFNKPWPFKIIHKFINKTGACNARNLALQQVTSNYVYLADDDNRFVNTLLETIIKTMQSYKLDVVSMSYLQENELETRKKPLQWGTFGAGSSVIHSKYLSNVAFNTALEFGYGEDVDFGMQLRWLGADIIYFPEIRIKHLKAPIGGFRSSFKQAWRNENIQPKPAPTVMLSRMLYNTHTQLLGYKTTLFIKFYKLQPIKNPFKYYNAFNKQWQASQFWANHLKVQNK